jgi:hypothetical protein
MVHRSPLVPVVTRDPVAVTVHVPHDRPLPGELTRADHNPRIRAPEDVLEVRRGLAFLEGGLGLIAEGSVVGGVRDERWALGLGH